MTAHVRGLGPLTWELATGVTSEHVLVIRTENDPAQRALARRLVLAAPDADEHWSYTDSRPAVPDLESMVLGGRDGSTIELSQVQVTARMNDGLLDVQVYHQAFADLSEDGRLLLTFLALDATLGEVDTELWLGQIQPVEFPPLDGFGLVALRSLVQDLKRQRLDADGRPRWVMLRGETKQGPLVAVVRSSLHPLTAPHLDSYLSVRLPYTHRTPDKLPDEASLQALEDFEQQLTEVLAGSGQVVGHVSRAGARTLHAYVDSTVDVLPAVKKLGRAWGEGRATVHEMPDPEWEAVRHLRG